MSFVQQNKRAFQNRRRWRGWLSACGVDTAALGVPNHILANEQWFWELIHHSYAPYWDSGEFRFGLDEIPQTCATDLVEFVERTMREYDAANEESVNHVVGGLRVTLGLNRTV